MALLGEIHLVSVYWIETDRAGMGIMALLGEIHLVSVYWIETSLILQSLEEYYFPPQDQL